MCYILWKQQRNFFPRDGFQGHWNEENRTMDSGNTPLTRLCERTRDAQAALDKAHDGERTRGDPSTPSEVERVLRLRSASRDIRDILVS